METVDDSKAIISVRKQHDDRGGSIEATVTSLVIFWRAYVIERINTEESRGKEDVVESKDLRLF